MTKSLINRLYLKQQLYTLRMHEGILVKDYFSEFEKIVMSLKNIGVKLNDENLALILLCSLPCSFVHFVDTMSFSRYIICFKDVKISLNSNELKKNVSNNLVDHCEDLVIGGKTGNRRLAKNRDKSDNHCYYCKEEGQWKNKCPKLKGKKKIVSFSTL